MSAETLAVARSLTNVSGRGFRVSFKYVEFVGLAVDAVVVAGSVGIGQALYGFVERTPRIDEVVVVGVSLFAVLTHSLFANYLGLYNLQSLVSVQPFLRRAPLVSLFVVLTLSLMLFLLKAGGNFSRIAFAIFMIAEFFGLIFARAILSSFLRKLFARKAVSGRPVIVITDKRETSFFAGSSLLFYFGQEEVGRIVLGPESLDVERVHEAMELARNAGAEAFNLIVDLSDTARLLALRQALRMSPLAVYLLPDCRIRSLLERDECISFIRRNRVLLQRAPLHAAALFGKRIFDVVIALAALISISPLLLIVAIAIRMDSEGPIIFRQSRRGFNQQPFTIYKFRSMTVQENGSTIRQAVRNDARVTRVGQYLRKYSLDELPQLLNVIQGSMSLVGPRPHAIAHDEHYGDKIDRYRMRHHVKPGITGWAQVNGIRGETAQIADMEARVEHDVWYVNNWSPLLDLSIVVRTCFTVLGHDSF